MQIFPINLVIESNTKGKNNTRTW